jgi:hypothetical protein
MPKEKWVTLDEIVVTIKIPNNLNRLDQRDCVRAIRRLRKDLAPLVATSGIPWYLSPKMKVSVS